MALHRHFRNESAAQTWARAAVSLAVLLGVFAAREVPSQFPGACLHRTVGADSHHDQRPRFVHPASEPRVLAGSVLVSPPAREAQRPASVARLLPTQTKGLHFNRPPPIS
jgi:hypothetical protein